MFLYSVFCILYSVFLFSVFCVIMALGTAHEIVCHRKPKFV